MKKICAVWMAALRPLIGKLAGLLMLLAAVEAALFQLALRDPLTSFPQALQQAHVPLVFLAALAVLCAALCVQGCQLSGKKMGYTLLRLPLPETAVTGLWALAHMGCILILWAWQLAVAFFLWRCYGRVVPEGFKQDLVLAISFYDSAFLHGLLPLADSFRHVRNILWVLSLGAATAAFGYFQRRGRIRAEALLLVLFGMWSFGTGINAGVDLALSVVWLILLASVIYGMWEVGRNEA